MTTLFLKNNKKKKMSHGNRRTTASAQNNLKFCTKFILTNFIFLTLQFASTSAIEDRGASFFFPEYAYKETSKNEIAYHEFEVTCEQTAICEVLEGVEKKACVRRCISYSCYQDIYAFDELEEGEIDVRLNSFKGCVIQRTGNTNRM